MRAGLLAGRRLLDRVRGAIQRVPRPVRRLVVGLVVVGLVVGGFAGVVLPLFTSSRGGPPMAEVAGLIPDSAPLNRTTDMEIALDNTGSSVIDPVCIKATFDRPVRVDHVIFQGLDRVQFRDGRACGGRLSSQETINIRLSIQPAAAGPIRVTIVPAQAGVVIGPGIHGTVQAGSS